MRAIVVCRLAIVCAFLALLPTAASAQSIAGIVRDASGGVLPGVSVEVASPALIEKVRSTVSDGQGRYQITDLRPGVYTVTFTLSGFSTFKRDGVELSSGFTASVNADMTVGSLEETITVSGAASLVDITNVRTQSVLAREVLDDIPGAKNFAGIAKMTLGATGGTNDVGGNRGEGGLGTIHGSGEGQTNVDGLRVTTLLNTGAGMRFAINQLVTEEVVITTGGANADSEEGGLTVNVVSKSGGNTFAGTLNFDYAGEKTQGNNLGDELIARGLDPATNIKVLKIYDDGGGIGGPIKKDSLWFYTAHRVWGTKENIPGVYFNKLRGTMFFENDLTKPAYTDIPQRSHSGKVTWQATQKQKLTLSSTTSLINNVYFQVGSTNRLGQIVMPEAGYQRSFSPNYFAQLTYSYPLTNRLLLETAVARKIEVKKALVTPDGCDSVPLVELSNNTAYGCNLQGPTPVSPWINDYGNHGNSGHDDASVAMSFVTGTHNLKTGLQLQKGSNPTGGDVPYDVQYQLRQRVPASLYQVVAPNSTVSKLKYNLGLYVQDQWTVKRLTLNLGLRYDSLNAYNPAQTLPGGRFLSSVSFAAVNDVPNWKDINPRLGVAYDLFGNGKTAVSASMGRYVVLEATTIANALNPGLAFAGSTTRTWNDSLFGAGDPRTGNFVADCDLKLTVLNGECGPMANTAFGSTRAVTQYSQDVLKGFGVRPYNWQSSVALQHELRRGIGVKVGYFHTTFGNFLATDNTLTVPGDFRSYCITAPKDPLLPGGGGNQICGLADVNLNRQGQSTTIVVPASDFGKQTRTYNGVDISMSAQHGGAWLSGGVSIGSTKEDRCAVAPDTPQNQFCSTNDVAKQVKFAGVYQLPYGIATSVVFTNTPGTSVAAVYRATNAEIFPSLDRNLSVCGTAVTCTQTVPVNLIEPFTIREPRQSTTDFRVSKTITLGRMKMTPRADVYNIFNANNVLSMNTAYGTSAWRRPLSVLGARLLKVGIQVNF